MDLYDILTIVALVISVASIIFVAIKEGIGFGLGYIEDEHTQTRRKSMETELQKEVEISLKQLASTREAREVERIVYRMHLAFSLPENALISIEHYAKRSLKCLGIALYFLFLSVICATKLEITIWYNALLLPVVAIPTAFCFFAVLKDMQKHYFLRKQFLLLYEKPTLDSCEKIVDELQEKGIALSL